jgi:hypothetical protein
MTKVSNGSVYKTMQGKQIDMVQLINQNELTVAVGNARVNARGDELGPGGRIIKKREEVLREYNNASIVPDQLNIPPVDPQTLTPAEIVKTTTKGAV